MPVARFRFVPYPLLYEASDRTTGRREPETSGLVVSSGRAFCDWETLFAAADGADWSLTVICSKEDFPQVAKLNKNGRASVYCEISREDHDRLLSQAALYVVCLKEGFVSSGHVRMRTATDAGVPILASSVRGLEGYVDHGNARLVPPSHPAALRAGIDDLLSNAVERRRLAERARAWANTWTHVDYVNRLRELVFECLDAKAQARAPAE
jgi:glycosyltransferase involved in cell wall biosynthesis